MAISEVSSGLINSSSQGLAQIVYENDTTVKVYLNSVVLSGFRYFGRPLKPWGLLKPVAFTGETYTSVPLSSIEGATVPQFTTPGQLSWTALFAVARPLDAYARFLFMPYLPVTAWNGTTKTATFDTVGGSLSGDLSGRECLIATEGGSYSGKVVRIVSNTASTIELSPVTPNGDTYTLSLASGDYLLPSPGVATSNLLYGYLRSFALDYVAAVPTYNWRNFSFSGPDCASYYGQVGVDITATSWGSANVINFRTLISPLATGVFGTLQAFDASATGGGAYVYIGHDNGNHVVASFGVDRVGSLGDGGTSPFRAPLFRNGYQLYGTVNASTVKGRLVLTGWTEY